MFTRQELIAELPRLAAADAPPLEVALVEGPEWEESLWAFRGWKRDFASGLLFWVKALQAQDWSGRESYFRPYTESGLCQPCTADEFARLVAVHSGCLPQPIPPFLGEFAGYRAGLQMSADWNDVAAVAELADTFVAFCWSTTA